MSHSTIRPIKSEAPAVLLSLAEPALIRRSGSNGFARGAAGHAQVAPRFESPLGLHGQAERRPEAVFVGREIDADRLALTASFLGGCSGPSLAPIPLHIPPSPPSASGPMPYGMADRGCRSRSGMALA